MYTVSVESRFSSAHNLRGYKGKCEDLHGHNWKVRLTVFSAELDHLGMVCDFTVLKDVLKKAIESLDHKYLNEAEYFKSVNPTSENIARYVFEEVSRIKPELNVKKVKVWETETSSATYSK
ncbi:MAG TPA: 6-carboxytetrahydropterin synthase QueD [Candidatus Omnitrophota bacterium]|nr:6-carboxytetrahydropterin synthase QueD [Candidatus Omnitrophota bacterium]